MSTVHKSARANPLQWKGVFWNVLVHVAANINVFLITSNRHNNRIWKVSWAIVGVIFLAIVQPHKEERLNEEEQSRAV